MVRAAPYGAVLVWGTKVSAWMSAAPADGRDQYGAWTENSTHHPPHGGRTPDTDGMAALDHDPGGTCPTGPHYFAPRQWGAHHRHCRHRRYQPALCLQMGAAVLAGWTGGSGRQGRARRGEDAAPARGVPPTEERCIAAD